MMVTWWIVAFLPSVKCSIIQMGERERCFLLLGKCHCCKLVWERVGHGKLPKTQKLTTCI